MLCLFAGKQYSSIIFNYYKCTQIRRRLELVQVGKAVGHERIVSTIHFVIENIVDKAVKLV